MYKIGIIGYGSIGKKHIKNIILVLEKRNISFKIDIIRSGQKKEVYSYGKSINAVYYKGDKVPDDYDIIFITNPTSMHFETVKKYVPKTDHMFIEKPVFDHITYDIEKLKLKDENTYYVACPLRYTDVISYIKNEINLKEVYSVRSISSSYLPDWRPGTDYRKTYSAKKSMGGGVSIDLIHEWDYLHYIFGEPDKIFNFNGKYSHLEIDSEDISIYIGKYKNMLVELHLDYFGRYPLRKIELLTKNDTIVGDLLKNEIRFLKEDRVISFKNSDNNFYFKEIENFFNIIENKTENNNKIDFALKTLKLAGIGD